MCSELLQGVTLPGHLLVGLSGGADSVALLTLLQERGVRLSAVHVNHGLRGDASDGDEAFVRQLCGARNVPLWVFRAEPENRSAENWAREARYAFFRQALALSGADALALAHHREDQAETMLLHLLRGTGLQGLGAMAADTQRDGMRILRPLLAASRAELRAYLASRGMTWREDGSNDDPRYLRNALRRDVMPLLEQLSPGASARMAAAATLLQGDEQTLQHMTAAWLQRWGSDLYLPLQQLQQEEPGMQRRILRAWWARAAGQGSDSLSMARTEDMMQLVSAGAIRRCNLPSGWLAAAGWSHLHLLPPGRRGGVAEHPAEGSPLIARLAPGSSRSDGRRVQAIPAAWMKDAVIRSRRTGDWIRPYGSQGRQSLQDYLVNRRVDAPFRDDIPLLCRGSEVLLAGGVGAGAIPALEEQQNPLLLQWQADFPWMNGGE